MLRMICCFARHGGGSTALEYGLVAAGVALVLTAMAMAVGGQVAATLVEPCDEISRQAGIKHPTC